MKREELLTSWTNFKIKLKEILKKPSVAEKETQTDLTAEQIKQMEQELATKRTELVKLVQEKKEGSEEYREKEQELSQLQTRYDLEVRSKKELLDYLNVYRKQNNYLQYVEDDKVGLKEFVDQHNHRYLNFFFIRLNKSETIDFNLIKKLMYSCCSILKIHHEKGEDIFLNNLPKKYELSVDFYHDSFIKGKHLLLCNPDKTKISYIEE